MQVLKSLLSVYHSLMAELRRKGFTVKNSLDSPLFTTAGFEAFREEYGSKARISVSLYSDKISAVIGSNSPLGTDEIDGIIRSSFNMHSSPVNIIRDEKLGKINMIVPDADRRLCGEVTTIAAIAAQMCDQAAAAMCSNRVAA